MAVGALSKDHPRKPPRHEAHHVAAKVVVPASARAEVLEWPRRPKPETGGGPRPCSTRGKWLQQAASAKCSNIFLLVSPSMASGCVSQQNAQSLTPRSPAQKHPRQERWLLLERSMDQKRRRRFLPNSSPKVRWTSHGKRRGQEPRFEPKAQGPIGAFPGSQTFPHVCSNLEMSLEPSFPAQLQ